jgi:type IV pilus assembly protein PilQ
MTTRNRTAPSLALVLIVALAAAGPAFATRGSSQNFPEWITVSGVEVQTQAEWTEIVLRGDFPINYLVYQPAPNKLVVEVRDCDVSRLAEPSLDDSRQVLALETSVDTSSEAERISQFHFTLAPDVRHSVTPVDNDLVVRFEGGVLAAASSPPAASPATHASVSTPPSPVHLAGGDGLIAFSATNAARYAEQAGIPAAPLGRALVGVDTADSDMGRVVLLLDGPAAYSTFELTDPPRLVVDFDDLVNEVLASRIPVDEGPLQRVRVSQFQTEPDLVARAVLDLASPASYEIQPTAEGLEIRLERETVPPVPDVEIAQVTSEPAPLAEELEALADHEAESVEPVIEPEVDAQDYAFYSASNEASGPEGGVKPAAGLTFESRMVSDDRPMYSGRRISLELVDADLKQVFRLFHEISGLNFVLDPSVNGKVTIVLDNVPWDQALDIILRNNGLDKVFENNVVRIATTDKLATEAQQRRALKEAARMEQDPVTITRVLSYARAEDVDQIVRRMLTSGVGQSGRFQSFYDQRTNTIVYTTIEEQADEITKLIDQLDARTPQVVIEARIVDSGRDFTRELGIDWGWIANDQRGAGNSFSAQYDLNLPRVADVNRLGISFGDLGPNGFAIDLALDALETEGRGRVLSAPKVAAQNNTTAIIEQGSQIPVVNTTATEINVEFISASLKLEVTPQITAEGTIIMDIQVENNSPDFDNLVGGTPSINTQRAETRVLVEDGGTTVIGGVFVLNEGESETGVPGLRKIPGLGWLFKSKTIKKENRELLIFITPKIAL